MPENNQAYYATRPGALAPGRARSTKNKECERPAPE